ncbi:hypothetical protein BDZ45DRAFT_722283 [Acephala macrosclerotiorum]|nr:hypothetical protein BDZ45DRAFT_722283 [Acephala macrosclerotiorum]
MTDHRVTDLSYGHLGKASYDTEENEWKFSVNLDQKSFIQQLTPFKEWHPPSIRNIPQGKEPPSAILKSQRRWLSKARPELFPANCLALNLSKEQSETSPHVGSLLAVGRAVDPDRVSGSRTTRILAVPHGDAGHILRLIKPRAETRGWGKRSAARLTLLESESPEYGHWVGEGGAIRQILAADSEGESGAWLAVRQDTATTIFRPQYGRLHDASTRPNNFPERFPASQLNPNPVATLTTEKSQSRMHADTAFNPWYARQFAVVDTQGIWSIWDLEKPHSKSKRQLLVPGGRGGIYDNYEPDPIHTAPAPGHFDGWYKILWVCNISTLVICNRRQLAVIDLSANQSRLQGEDIVLPKSHDWILDIKRSGTNECHLFVLTTSRIFWVEVVPKGGEGERALGLKVLLSYRHFKNADDETMKLVALNDHKISVLITSSTSPLVLFYRFGEFMDPLDVPSSCQGSFSWSNEVEKKHVGAALSHLCFLPLALTPSTSVTPAGPGLEYMDSEVKFFQAWILGAGLEMSSILCATHSQPSEANKILPITAPTSRVRKSVNRFGSRIAEESFIVQDGMEEEDDLDRIQRDSLEHDMQIMLLDEWQDDLRFRINWRRVYRRIFGLDLGEKLPAPKAIPTMAELFVRVSDHIRHGMEDNELATSTFAEMSGFEVLSEDIEEAAQALRQFFRSLELEPDSEAATTLVVSNLAMSARSHLPNSEIPGYSDLSTLYDQMAEYWMTSLPPNVSNWARVARYRVIRQLAIDVCLSSVGISIENKLVSAAGPPQEGEDDRLSLPTLGRDSRFGRDTSPTYFSSQLATIPDREVDHRLPTPAKTPSLYSHATSASDLKEDPTISRLRQYAPSIKAESDIGSSRLRSEWKPGADPYEYSYQEAQKARAAAESGDESEHRNSKEEARRRRRTEKFLRQERSRAVEAAAQSMFKPSGSQPAVSRHFASSQTVDDVPMTQPELGTFGSRVGQKAKKKSKKPRTAGFR